MAEPSIIAKSPVGVFASNVNVPVVITAETEAVILDLTIHQANGFTSYNVPTLNSVNGQLIIEQRETEQDPVRRAASYIWLLEDLPSPSESPININVTSGGNRTFGLVGKTMANTKQEVPQVVHSKPIVEADSVSITLDNVPINSLVLDVIGKGFGDRSVSFDTGQEEEYDFQAGNALRTAGSSVVAESDGNITFGASWQLAPNGAHIIYAVEPDSVADPEPEGHHFTIHRPVGA
jgi:hypothetical protein